jgi:hypothetical protein
MFKKKKEKIFNLRIRLSTSSKIQKIDNVKNFQYDNLFFTVILDNNQHMFIPIKEIESVITEDERYV